MFKIRSLLPVALLVIPIALTAQNRFTVSGTIRDKVSGETLIGASILLLGQSHSTALSNSYGFYSLNSARGNYKMVIRFAGSQSDTIDIALTKDVVVAVNLPAGGPRLQEVVVTASKSNNNVSKPLRGVRKVSMDEIKALPVLFGEKDIFKTIQLLPGVQSGGDGSSGFYVRGGSVDQNLILLDEATVYNPSHLLGFFSTFNSDAIKDITVYKGGMPAEYGSRLSSVVDIKMNDGNNKDYYFGGGIGLISTRLNAEGPIVKANYRIDEKNRVYLSGYFGRDNLGFGSTFGIDYGNATGTARWNHVFNSRLFSNTSVIYSNYSYKIKINSDNNDINITSNIRI